MKSHAIAVAFACLPLALIVTACSSTSVPTRYPVAHTSVAHKLEQGTVIRANEVVIDGQATNLGMIVGGGLGGAAGAVAVPVQTTAEIVPNSAGGLDVDISSNRHENRAAMAVGAALGTVVGRKVEKKLSEKKAQELTIKLDSGETVVIVQQRRDQPFYDNERVQVYTTRLGNSRVFHADEDPYVDPETNAYIPDDAEIEHEYEPVTW